MPKLPLLSWPNGAGFQCKQNQSSPVRPKTNIILNCSYCVLFIICSIRSRQEKLVVHRPGNFQFWCIATKNWIVKLLWPTFIVGACLSCAFGSVVIVYTMKFKHVSYCGNCKLNATKSLCMSSICLCFVAFSFFDHLPPQESCDNHWWLSLSVTFRCSKHYFYNFELSCQLYSYKHLGPLLSFCTSLPVCSYFELFFQLLLKPYFNI